MVSRDKVIWSEGMFLRPQHFQQFERHMLHTAQQRAAMLQGCFWGFGQLSLDRDALAIGKVAVTRAQGVMPDGTPFDFSHPDAAPAAFEVPAQTRGARVVLALPRVRAGASDVIYEGEEDTLARYLVHEAEVEDSGSVALEPVLMQLGRLRLRLMLEDELTDDWLGLGVARVLERRSDNRVVLDEGYVAPWLAAGEHPVLRGFVDELQGLLDARSEALASRLSQPGRGGVSEVSDFMLLETVNRYMGSIWHARQLPAQHPERLFHDWLMLACDLATFTSATRRPGVLPDYVHDDLQGSFTPLMNELRRSLSAVLEQRALQIPLQDRGQGVRVAQIQDAELLQSAGFVLAVHADMGVETVRARFPAQVKIGPVERIRDLVHLQLPGVGVRALPVAPRQIPYSAGHVYFELDKSGEFWKQLERTGALALHLAGDFPGLTMEFWALRD
ncbi:MULTISPECIES: type VI secretion system baseplate subunit TssK [Achromobacter]|uniref:Type VI secretion system baseplate subunit TssK n=1 Tax=Alcaligenes xylosoxydans xylosoxydans TaxID=85698 RepID=A0A424WBB8_ALCXX|nr:MULTISPECIES: type VI secretion system baseplate subunit TssK [Achromobacter]MBC9907129.1 type VI secretion system baseplate subunit TssK [Achromobacter xylosoxidans]MBD0870334.1 type VI secretion system baseplate subunit TssK [Achromobacter xylosoxidans]QNP85812.1 type VI secretion system baseplate subunit TssK [Achromobacter xylosoxidans]RPJ90515.1 type VI secretion system baseplate subunit TssK [Achromobacter xylosoxidans]WLW61697.1 type VI secretion system baseplate subunit TssK [Achrom